MVDNQQLASLVARLEKAVVTLEKSAAKGGGGGSGDAADEEEG